MNLQNKIVMSIAIRLLAERHMVTELADGEFLNKVRTNQTQKLLREYTKRGCGDSKTDRILDAVVLMTPENIHVNSFMYEPIIDMSDVHLRELYRDVKKLSV